jgi:iron complex outermembrane receptor protein
MQVCLTSHLSPGFLPLIIAVTLPTTVHAQPHAQEANDAPSESDESSEVVDVTVQGARYRPPVSPRDPTAASTVLSEEAIQSPGATTAEVLARAPGVQVSRTGAGSDLATASIRGATSAQTPVLLAGIPLNDDVAGTADLSMIPLWMLDRVEVYRGHAPGFAGQLGIGGAILFEPRLPRRTTFGFGQGVGSFGELSTWIAGAIRSDQSASLVALRRSRANNDYEFVDDAGTRFDTSDDTHRTRHNADFVADEGWAVTRHSLGANSDVTVLANAFDREQGVTGLAVIPARHARAWARRFLGGITTRTPCADPRHGEAESPCKLTLSSAVVVAATEIHDPLGELALQSPLLSTEATRFTQQAHVDHRFDDTFEISIHGSQATERLHVDPAGSSGLRASRHTSRLAATATKDLHPTLAAHAIAGAECHTTVGPEPSSACGVFEPYGRLGTRWTLSSWLSLFANVGRYVRPPTLGELYGTSPIVRGTPNLAAERGTSLDVGARATGRGEGPADLAGYVEIFAFNRWVSDLVAFQRSSFGVIRPFNVGNARIAGLEIAGGGVWLDHIVNEFTMTLLDPRDTTQPRVLTNDILPFRSRLVVSNKLELFTDPAAPCIRLDRASLAARVHHGSSRFADPAGLIVIEAQTTVDLELAGHFLERSVSGRLATRNVFDATQFDTVGYPLPGRSYHANVEAWF